MKYLALNRKRILPIYYFHYGIIELRDGCVSILRINRHYFLSAFLSQYVESV